MTYKELRKYVNKKSKKTIVIPKFVYKFMVTVIVFLVTLVLLKGNQNYKQVFYEKVYNTNIKFASINSVYQKYLGNILPFDLFKSETKPVFNENLKYTNPSNYLNGVTLSVDKNYLVPSIDNGIVIFVGEKEGYNNTVIVECENGIEVWYGNIDTTNVKMYDYIKKGSLIGEVSDNLYMVFMKDGNYLNYEDYI